MGGKYITATASCVLRMVGRRSAIGVPLFSDRAREGLLLRGRGGAIKYLVHCNALYRVQHNSDRFLEL